MNPNVNDTKETAKLQQAEQHLRKGHAFVNGGMNMVTEKPLMRLLELTHATSILTSQSDTNVLRETLDLVDKIQQQKSGTLMESARATDTSEQVSSLKDETMMVVERLEQNQSELMRRLQQMDTRMERSTDKIEESRCNVIEYIDEKMKEVSEVQCKQRLPRNLQPSKGKSRRGIENAISS